MSRKEKKMEERSYSYFSLIYLGHCFENKNDDYLFWFIYHCFHVVVSSLDQSFK